MILLCIQLVLRDNDMIVLPPEVGELQKLKELHIQNNRLQVLPPEIGEFHYLLASFCINFGFRCIFKNVLEERC